MSLKKKVKKPLLILANFTLMTAIREKFAKNFKKSKNAKNAEDNKKNKYLNTNLVQVLYIQYFIIF